MADILEAALTLDSGKLPKLADHRLPLCKFAIHFLRVRQPWLYELPESAAGCEKPADDKTSDFHRQADPDQNQCSRKRKPSIRQLATENADGGRQCAHPNAHVSTLPAFG